MISYIISDQNNDALLCITNVDTATYNVALSYDNKYYTNFETAKVLDAVAIYTS